MGYFIVFKAMQYEVKSEIKAQIIEGIDPLKLVSITINKAEQRNIEWFDEGNEMLYNNKLYDIVRSTENKSSTTYYCISDTEETELIANFDNHINENLIANKALKNESLIKLLDKDIKLFFSNEKSIYTSLDSSFQFSFISIIYQGPQIQTILPPPKFG